MCERVQALSQMRGEGTTMVTYYLPVNRPL